MPIATAVHLSTNLKRCVHRGADVPGGILELRLRQRRAARRRPIDGLPSSEDVPLREHLSEHLAQCRTDRYTAAAAAAGNTLG